MNQVNMILAVSRNGVIGKNGGLPWRIIEDLRAFKAQTLGGVLFVGKKTSSTLPPLKDREVVCLSRESFPTLLDVKNSDAWSSKPLWIIGGAEIYRAALELGVVDKVLLTMVDADYDGDTMFDVAPITQSKKFELKQSIKLREEPLVVQEEWVRV